MKKLMFVVHRLHESQFISHAIFDQEVNGSDAESDEELFIARKRPERQSLEKIVEKEWKIMNSSSIRSDYLEKEYENSRSCNLERREIAENEHERFLYRRINGNEVSEGQLTTFSSIRKKVPAPEFISQTIIDENATDLLKELQNQRSAIPSKEQFPRQFRKRKVNSSFELPLSSTLIKEDET
jgi:hypothetical protein